MTGLVTLLLLEPFLLVITALMGGNRVWSRVAARVTAPALGIHFLHDGR